MLSSPSQPPNPVLNAQDSYPGGKGEGEGRTLEARELEPLTPNVSLGEVR
jgi:hypothetical protein